MSKMFQEPVMEITSVEVDDIITTSNNPGENYKPGENELPGM